MEDTANIRRYFEQTQDIKENFTLNLLFTQYLQGKVSSNHIIKTKKVLLLQKLKKDLADSIIYSETNNQKMTKEDILEMLE